MVAFNVNVIVETLIAFFFDIVQYVIVFRIQIRRAKMRHIKDGMMVKIINILLLSDK